MDKTIIRLALGWRCIVVPPICGNLSLTCAVKSSILMTGEHPSKKKNSTLVLFCQAVQALPMREMVLLGEGMTHRHNIPQEQEKTIQQNHMSGRPLRARPDGAAGFAHQSA